MQTTLLHKAPYKQLLIILLFTAHRSFPADALVWQPPSPQTPWSPVDEFMIELIEQELRQAALAPDLPPTPSTCDQADNTANETPPAKRPRRRYSKARICRGCTGSCAHYTIDSTCIDSALHEDGTFTCPQCVEQKKKKPIKRLINLADHFLHEHEINMEKLHTRYPLLYSAYTACATIHSVTEGKDYSRTTKGFFKCRGCGLERKNCNQLAMHINTEHKDLFKAIQDSAVPGAQ